MFALGAAMATNTALTKLECVASSHLTFFFFFCFFFVFFFLMDCLQIRECFFSLSYNQIREVSALAAVLATNTTLKNLK